MSNVIGEASLLSNFFDDGANEKLQRRRLLCSKVQAAVSETLAEKPQ